MNIEKVLENIRSVTDKHTTIEVQFSTNVKKWDEPEEVKKQVKVKWTLYIADITNKTGNAFPEFSCFSQLESFVNILVLELRRVNLNSVENAIQNAIEILKMEESKTQVKEVKE